MRYVAVAALLLLSLMGSATAGDEAVPDTSGILSLVGRYALAHACPISAEFALTNAHVVDLRPFDFEAPLYPYVWSDGQGHRGLLRPWYVLTDRDLAVAVGTFPKWYERAAAAPEPGDRIWFLGYRYDGKNTLAERLFSGRVLRVVAGHVIYDALPQPGSSGSCVLNERGEVVAVNAGGFERAGLGVGVWLTVFQVRELPKPEPEAEQ